MLSLAITIVQRPSTRTKAVTTPAPGRRALAELAAVVDEGADLEDAEPSSLRSSMRSRVVSLPFWCTRSTYFVAPAGATSRALVELAVERAHGLEVGVGVVAEERVARRPKGAGGPWPCYAAVEARSAGGQPGIERVS